MARQYYRLQVHYDTAFRRDCSKKEGNGIYQRLEIRLFHL